MPAAKIQCDYDGIGEAANTFKKEAEQTERLIQALSNMVGSLQGGGFLGEASVAFYQEMEDLVNPAMGRLRSALDEAADAAKRVADALQQAEEEGGALFRS
jgi:WXG100 family type VII secretion target